LPPLLCFRKGIQDSNNLNAARMSAAGEGLTEPNNYLCKAQMQTSPVERTK